MKGPAEVINGVVEAAVETVVDVAEAVVGVAIVGASLGLIASGLDGDGSGSESEE